MQALGGGSLEFPALGPASGGGPEDLSEPVQLPIEDSLDLHSFRPADVPSVIDEYLIAAHARGFTEVRLIHGRGIGVQRQIVRGVLARHPAVETFSDAPSERGGWGATVVRLRAA